MREVNDRYRPFCSERCKMVDLGRWLSGDYRVPAEAGPEDGSTDEDEPSEPPGYGPH